MCEENPPDSHWARVPPRRCGERVSLIIFADFFQYGFFAHFLRTYTADYWTESLAHLLFNDNFPLSINTFSSRKIYRHNLCWAPHLICSFAKNKSQFNPHSHKGSFSIHHRLSIHLILNRDVGRVGYFSSQEVWWESEPYNIRGFLPVRILCAFSPYIHRGLLNWEPSAFII